MKNTHMTIQAFESMLWGLERIEEKERTYRLYRMQDGSLLEVDLENGRILNAMYIDEHTGEVIEFIDLEEFY